MKQENLQWNHKNTKDHKITTCNYMPTKWETEKKKWTNS